MQYGFYVNQSRCTACLACAIACLDYHDIADATLSPIRVKTIEKGDFPDLYVAFFPVLCYHCANPACAAACPANAIARDERDGIVTVDPGACLGRSKCGLCIEACPYGVPQFGPAPDAPMLKCDLCKSRWADGKKPVCIEACPMLAMDAGPLDELAARYQAVRAAEGFDDSADVVPSLVCRPVRDTRNRAVKRVEITPRRPG